MSFRILHNANQTGVISSLPQLLRRLLQGQQFPSRFQAVVVSDRMVRERKAIKAAQKLLPDDPLVIFAEEMTYEAMKVFQPWSPMFVLERTYGWTEQDWQDIRLPRERKM